ncbi:MAG: VCBS repeat-containing protein [Acidobacteria bacterium]|nr:VCBS repeat-containing protein [Acidobacteriota bacterium]
MKLPFSPTTLRRLPLPVLFGVVTLAVVVAAQPGPRDIRERAWQANNLGVAYLEQFNYDKAAAQFEAALAVDPGLVPARVNLAIAQLYAPDLAAAQKSATAASAAADAPPHADFVLGLIARSENREADGLAAFRRVLQADPDDVASLVNVGQLLLQQRAYAEAVPMFGRAVELEPYNVSALYNLAVAQTRAGAREAGAATTAKFQSLRETGYGTTYSNAYMEQGRYAEAILSTGAEADLAPNEAPALTYTAQEQAFGAVVPDGGWRAAGAADLDADGRTDVIGVTATALDLYTTGAAGVLTRTLPAGTPSIPLPASFEAHGVIAADIDNDGKCDLVALGRGGVVILRQRDTLTFEDVTRATGITTTLDVRTAALVDLDHDGDVDLVFGGATRDQAAAAALAVWRNNGDGTFADISGSALPGQTPLVVRSIVPTDVDLRRDIDLLVLADDGKVRLWRNMRDASFREMSEAVGLAALPAAGAMAVADVTKDGYPDIVLSVSTGSSVLAVGSSSNNFTSRALAAVPAGATALQVTDVDNDGLLDVVAVTAAGVRVIRQVGVAWEDVSERVRSNANGRTSPTATPAEGVGAGPGVGAGLVRRGVGRTSPTATSGGLLLLDADRNGAIDVLTTHDGAARLLLASAPTRPSMSVTLTAQVSNRSGVGSKVEMRAGSLWQKLETSAAWPAAAPADLLFGLGARPAADVVRVLWPAGIVQAEALTPETQKAARLEVVELDRKPSSCPYLYTWTGDRFEFVTDFLGGGEMGYQVSPGVYSTPDPEEFVRIPGDRLRARDGRYELRITNELEETLFLDHLSLLAVDHPAGVDVFPKEGLVSAPVPALQLQAVIDRRPAARVVDASGDDATVAAAGLDRLFVDGLPRLPIRGYARPHAITIDLGAQTPIDGAVLLLTGWTDYAFSSDNVAAAQAGHALHPPALQVRGVDGQWQTIIGEIGVPVGRPQTIVVDLSDRFVGSSREVRITTSMRVYWDQIEVATRADGPAPVVARLPTATADLHWRGFSAVATRQEPLTFDYAQVSSGSPWKQMPGRYTREGDVRALLEAVDDQFVVARPGDEVAFAVEARALPPLRDGWRRTFILHADGFSKEMDLNSASPDQAWPLPSHRMTRYPTPASPLDEPAWFTRYNTRVVGRQVPRLAGVTP